MAKPKSCVLRGQRVVTGVQTQELAFARPLGPAIQFALAQTHLRHANTVSHRAGRADAVRAFRSKNFTETRVRDLACGFRADPLRDGMAFSDLLKCYAG